MHVKEIYVIFIHLLDSGKLLIIDLNKKKRERGGGILFVTQIDFLPITTVCGTGETCVFAGKNKL
jgi:hypothetical protein